MQQKPQVLADPFSRSCALKALFAELEKKKDCCKKFKKGKRCKKCPAHH